MTKIWKFRDFCRILGRTLFASVVCICAVFGTMGAAGAVNYAFSVTTTPLASGDTFSFKISAAGTFYIDCGGVRAGLTTTGDSSEITPSAPNTGTYTITRSNTNQETYTCGYRNTASSRTVRFGGTATGYGSSAAISFDGNTEITSISGNLSAIFPYNGSANSHPRFYRSFANCTNLTTITGPVFGDYETAATSAVFGETFMGCTALTTISETMFQNLTTVGCGTFQQTFKYCTSLTALPQSLFSSITSINCADQQLTFMETFSLCTGLDGYIPPDLFAGLIPRNSDYPLNTMNNTFVSTNLWLSCEEHDMCQYTTGWEYQNAWGQYKSCKPCVTVDYDCNDGGGNGYSHSYAEGSSISADQNILDNYAQCDTASRDFAGWYCSYGHNDVGLSNLVSVENVDTTGVYVHDNFACFGTTCDFTLTADTECVALWRNTNMCPNDGTVVEYVLGNPASQFTSTMWNETASTTANDTNIFPSYGSVTFESRCSATDGLSGSPGNPSPDQGKHCWCRVKEYQPSGGTSPIQMTDMPWVLVESMGSNLYDDYAGCNTGCMSACTKISGVTLSLRQALYSTYSCQYDVTYYCNNGPSNGPSLVENYLDGASVTVPAQSLNCNVPSGYELVGWYCGWGDNNVNISVTNSNPYTISVPENFVTSVDSGSTASFIINHNTVCKAVWKKTNPCPNNGTVTEYVMDQVASDVNMSQFASGDRQSDTIVNFPNSSQYNNVYVTGMLSTTPGLMGVAGDPLSTSGDHCWCRVMGYCPSGVNNCSSNNGNFVSLDYMQWVYIGDYTSLSQCQYNCTKYPTGGDGHSVLLNSYFYADRCQYNVTYDCGSGSNYTGSGSNPMAFASGDNVNTNGATCATMDGYDFTGWDCSYVDTNNNTQNLDGSLFTMPSYNVTCTAQWTENIPSKNILTYVCGTLDNGAAVDGGNEVAVSGDTYTVNGVVGNPAVDHCATPSGYDFVAWYCANSDSPSVNASVINNDSISILEPYGGGSGYGDVTYTIYSETNQTIAINNNMTCLAIWRKSNPCAPGTESFLVNADWDIQATGDENGTISFDYGTIGLDGLCSKTAGVPGIVGNPSEDVPGPYCWCRLASYQQTGGKMQQLGDISSWVFNVNLGEFCTTNSACAQSCRRYVNDSGGHEHAADLRHGLYSSYVCKYNVKYDCGGGTFISGGTYADYPHSMTVTENSNYSISNANDVCTPASNFGFNTNGSNVIANGWICTADNVSPTLYLSNASGIWNYTNNYTCTAQYTENAPAQYNISYNCDNDNIAVSNPSSTLVTVGSPYSLVNASVCMPKEGYSLVSSGTIGGGWICMADGASPTVYLDNASGIWDYNNNYTCTARWEQNTVWLEWLDDSGTIITGDFSGSCVYNGGNMNLNYTTTPTRTGYTFNGWLLTGWDECGLRKGAVKENIHESGEGYSYWNLSDNSQHIPTIINLPGKQTWVVAFAPYGLVYGKSMCSHNNSTPIEPDVDNPGDYCWCRVTRFMPLESERCDLYYSDWQRVPVNVYDGDPTTCAASCARGCAESASSDQVFREKLYGLK